MDNYLKAQEVNYLAKFFGKTVRAHLLAPALTDSQLIHLGNVKNAYQEPVRIEIRPTGKMNLANAQVVVRAFKDPFRQEVIRQLKQLPWVKRQGLVVKASGTMSIECNRFGVDKALPLCYLSHRWLQVLDIMGYTPGLVIDARKMPVLLGCDGDDTLYHRPTLHVLPRLSQSAALTPLKELLKTGMVFILISGNDARRTEERIKGCFGALGHRVLVCANGGADLMYYGKNKKLLPVPGYRQQALNLRKKAAHGKIPLEVFYIGDDAFINGNDGPAFAWVKPKGRFCVSDHKPDAIWKIPSGQWRPGKIQATVHWLKLIRKLF